MKPKADILHLFDVPVITLDKTLHIREVNEAFEAIFGKVVGQLVTDFSDEFKARKFQRRIDQGQSYSFRIHPSDDVNKGLILEIKAFDEGYFGFGTDAVPLMRAEALMASYSQMIEKQNREIKVKTEQLQIWSKRINEELEQAKTVQKLLVPDLITYKGLASHCLPLRELSGDFHEAILHDDGQLTFISGDVAGKGIYAAIILAQTLTAFRSCYVQESLNLVAARIAQMLEDRFPDGLFAALTLVRQSADKQTISLLNLGNPDALLLDDTGIKAQYESIGPAIGVLPADFYEVLEPVNIKLENHRLYVFSDGIIDMKLGDDCGSFESADEANDFIAKLDKSYQHHSIDRLMEMVKRYEQIDDVTLACFCAELA